MTLDAVAVIGLVVAYLAIGVFAVGKVLGPAQDASELPLMGLFVLMWPMIALMGALGILASQSTKDGRKR